VQPGHQPDGVEKAVCQTGSSWFGWSHNAEVGKLELILPSTGTGSIDFGNCWDTGEVVVYISGRNADVEIGRAGVGEGSVNVDFSFQAGQIISIRDEGANSVARLNGLTLKCSGGGTSSLEFYFGTELPVSAAPDAVLDDGTGFHRRNDGAGAGLDYGCVGSNACT
jgi:hypothetical protein